MGYSNNSIVSNSYVNGFVDSDGAAGGVVGGENNGQVLNSFWSIDSGIAESAGGTGKTNNQLSSISTFTDEDTVGLDNAWDFAFTSNDDEGTEDIWAIHEDVNGGFPYLLQHYSVSSCADLQNMDTVSASNYYKLTQDIDCDIAPYNQNEGFLSAGGFSGILNGDYYTVSGLYINRPDTNNIGLIGSTVSSASIGNININGLDITGADSSGGLVGRNEGSILNSHILSGDITGSNDIGGLVGRNEGSILSSSSVATVTGSSAVGGLVGYNDSALIENSYAGGAVQPEEGFVNFGGLVGYSNNSEINNSYSNTTVNGPTGVGGLVGYSVNTMITNSYSFGDVLSDGTVGGLIGLVNVAGNVSSSFWDTESSGQAESADGIGKTTNQMKSLATFTDEDTVGLDNAWDFIGTPNDDNSSEDIWAINSTINGGYPYLVWQFSPPLVTTNAASGVTDVVATLNGEVTNIGVGAVTEQGFEYGLTNQYGQVYSDEGNFDVGVFSKELEELTCGTTYYYRAFAVNEDGTGFGEGSIFNTDPCLGAPEVTTNAASDITDAIATLNGEVTNIGAGAVTERGFEYGTTVQYGSEVSENGNFEAGVFSQDLEDLECGTTYYYRAFAVNEDGTGFGANDTFETEVCPVLPTLSYLAPRLLEDGLVLEFNAEITDLGTEAVTERGFEYGVTDQYGSELSAEGNFEIGQFWFSIQNPECGTTYYYRAFAVSAVGTRYANGATYVMDPCPEAPTLTTNAATSLTRTAATLNAEITDLGTEEVTERGFEYGLTDQYGSEVSEEGDFELGVFESDIQGLTCNTTYHFRSFAINAVDTAYGDDVTFTTSACAQGGGGGGGGGPKADTPKDEEALTYEQEVAEVLAKGIVTQNPTADSNKCEVLTMMARVFAWQVPATNSTVFIDVPAWCVSVAEYARTNSIVQGRTATILGLDSPVSRYEVAVMLYRELQRQSRQFKGTEAVNFSDAVVDWARTAVNALAKESIIKGFSDGTFGGQKGILKQDLGIMLLRTTR